MIPDQLHPAISPNCTGQHLFLCTEYEAYTYQDLQCFGEFFLGILKEHGGIKRDRPVGILAEPCTEVVFVIAACWKLGIPFVPFNPEAPTALLKQQLDAISPSVVITDATGKIPSGDYRTIETKQLRYTNVFSRNAGNQPGSGIQSNRHTASKIFGYFFTSGTSAQPKIVPLKRRQMQTAAEASALNFKPATNECWLLCLPLHHIGGISVILRSLIYGSAIYFSSRFEAAQTRTLLAKNSTIVAASLVPTMLGRLLDEPKFSVHDAFKAILLGGGPISTTLIKDCINRNIPVIPSYGMTESCAQIAANPIFEEPEHEAVLQSAGKVFKPNEIEIRSNSSTIMPAGKSGTIWLKGPQIFDGYLNDSAQDSFDQNGWFNTGDFGRLDDVGNLYIEARRADLIITGGENVSPFEVEEALHTIDGIREAAVTGMPDEKWGQKVVATVVFEEGKDVPEQKIKKILHKKLEGFKVPKKIKAVDSLPRTETGKIKRGELASFFERQ